MHYFNELIFVKRSKNLNNTFKKQKPCSSVFFSRLLPEENNMHRSISIENISFSKKL